MPVAETRDYGIRGQKNAGGELGLLVDAFNQMLRAIQSRDDDLRETLTTREEALKLAQTTRDSLETNLSSIGDSVKSTDVAGLIVFANRIAPSLLRSSAEEMAGTQLDEVFHFVSSFLPVETGSGPNLAG